MATAATDKHQVEPVDALRDAIRSSDAAAALCKPLGPAPAAGLSDRELVECLTGAEQMVNDKASWAALIPTDRRPLLNVLAARLRAVIELVAIGDSADFRKEIQAKASNLLTRLPAIAAGGVDQPVHGISEADRPQHKSWVREAQALQSMLENRLRLGQAVAKVLQKRPKGP